MLAKRCQRAVVNPSCREDGEASAGFVPGFIIPLIALNIN
jgi:hypothetical protein